MTRIEELRNRINIEFFPSERWVEEACDIADAALEESKKQHDALQTLWVESIKAQADAAVVADKEFSLEFVTGCISTALARLRQENARLQEALIRMDSRVDVKDIERILTANEDALSVGEALQCIIIDIRDLADKPASEMPEGTEKGGDDA
ncbi:MAG: hypothetical protein KOO63_03030 [Bacteroidales bacterium]|nr:hypothetical protein [Candidatus Latescibacterota bacterium]